MEIIDLHTHTTASDGSDTPAQLVRRARELGLRAMAVTDHDTLGGLDEAVAEGRRLDLEIVAGVEISAEFPKGTLHLLGYDFNPRDPELGRTLEGLQDARANRNPRIVEKLRDLGLDLTMEEVQAVAGGPVVGRPHFARVLLEKGYVQTTDQAFVQYLAKGRPAYVEKARLMPVDALAMIRRAQGLPVLAHPYSLGLDPEALRGFIGVLAETGLAGIEAHYSEHSPEQTAQHLELAREFNLAVTGGSDYHGASKAEIRLGSGRGNLHIPYRLLEDLRRHG
jgi:predicted metal-dependent phosphoesterase TrpH